MDEVLPRDAGGGQRDGSSKAIAQIVRLLDTIEVLGSPGHLSRPSDEGKVVEPKLCGNTQETNRTRQPPAETEPPQEWETTERGLEFFCAERRPDEQNAREEKADLAVAARAAASTLRNAMDSARVAEIFEGSNATGLGALGPAATRETLDQRRVRELYLTHHYLENHAAEAEAAVRSAIDQGALIEEVSGAAADQLDAHGGMAARLRYRLAPAPTS